MKNHILFFLVSLICSCNQANADKSVVDEVNQSKVEVKTTYDDLEEALQNKTDVITLMLREQNLTEFPIEVMEFVNLKNLDLSMNKFTTLPSDFSKIKGLKKLAIGHGRITEFPKEINGLEDLETLVLIYNKITNIPPSICNLRKLSYLSLDGNDIVEIPECISELPLRTLGLYPKSLDAKEMKKKFKPILDKLKNCRISL